MSDRYRMHIAALVQRNDEALFRKIHHEYACEHSKGIAQYMVDTLQYWDDGRVEIQPQTLRRFSAFPFPNVSSGDRHRLIEGLYREYRTDNPETYDVSFRIDHNIPESTECLNRIVDNFTSDDYDLSLSYDLTDGIAWICQDDLGAAQSILRRYTQPIGKDNYASTRQAVDEFLSTLESGELPLPFEQRFELVHGYISVDYKHRLRKRIGDAFKNVGKKVIFWK